MTREELIKRIALKMDEISSSDDVIEPVGTGDNNPLYTQINNLLNESVNDVLMKAPIYRINSQVEKFDANKVSLKLDNAISRKVAEITVPDNFIRLVSISHEDFHRQIVDLAIEGDEVDKRQHNEHLVAKCAKPVAVISRDLSDTGKGVRLIRCYSFKSDETSKPVGYYIKRYDTAKNDTTAEVDIDDYLIDIVSWVCAGKVFAAQGDINKGKVCDENAIALMA